MISNIGIENFAVIKKLSLALAPGFNVITGETGSGKSVVIEAISMALGARADMDYIRSGESRAVIEMSIDLCDCDRAAVGSVFDELGIPADDPVIIRRELSAQGKSLCRVNGSLVPLSALGKLCRLIADIHGQYDHQFLLSPENHAGVLDAYGGAEIADCKSKVAEAYAKYVAASEALMKLKKSITESERQRDLLRFELEEINAADLKEGEDEALEQELELIKNSEKIYEALSAAYSQLNDGGGISGLGSASSELKRIESYSQDIRSLLERSDELYYLAQDVATDIRHLRDSVSYSQEDFEYKSDRLEEINRLKRKYGGSVSAVIAYGESVSERLSVIENADQQTAALEKDILAFRADYDALANMLTELRRLFAGRLSSLITKELSELNFRDAQFDVSIRPSAPSASGSDSVEFLIRTNAGEELKPLSKIASGGELSRIMLAIKGILADTDVIPTVIFDEIDTGISGATADVVGRKMRRIAEKHQLVCITHLPQIAALGEHNYKIEKTSDGAGAYTSIKALDDAEKVEELARLLSGSDITESARAQARELMRS